MHAQKREDSERVIRSLDAKTKEELMELLSEIVKNNNELSNNRNSRRKELEGFDFHTDYW